MINIFMTKKPKNNYEKTRINMHIKVRIRIRNFNKKSRVKGKEIQKSPRINLKMVTLYQILRSLIRDLVIQFPKQLYINDQYTIKFIIKQIIHNHISFNLPVI